MPAKKHIEGSAHFDPFKLHEPVVFIGMCPHVDFGNVTVIGFGNNGFVCIKVPNPPQDLAMFEVRLSVQTAAA